MSNAVKSLSAPLAQCVKHRSSNQTLTGSNLAEYPLFIFFFFFFFFFYSFNPSMYYSIAITVMEKFHVDIHPRKKEVRF